MEVNGTEMLTIKSFEIIHFEEIELYTNNCCFSRKSKNSVDKADKKHRAYLEKETFEMVLLVLRHSRTSHHDVRELKTCDKLMTVNPNYEL